MSKRFKWTIEIEVDETWVADGFDMTDERAHNMLMHHLPYAYGHELGARVLARPPMAEVNVAQGAPHNKQRAGWPCAVCGSSPDVCKKLRNEPGSHSYHAHRDHALREIDRQVAARSVVDTSQTTPLTVESIERGVEETIRRKP